MRELEILKRLLPRLPQGDSVALGPGDDCAAVAFDSGAGPLLLAAVDQVAGRVHYTPDTAPERVGAKLLKRNLSDIAAMGGVPEWALLTVAAGGRDDDWILRLATGAAEAARAFGVSLIGGDLAHLPETAEVATLTILGKVGREEIVRRSGLRPGDALYCTGTLGNSFATEHHLDFTPRLAEGRYLAQHRLATAMLDISDGPGLDAARLAAASGVAVELDLSQFPLRRGATPESALTDGEDYELLFGASPDLAARWPDFLTPVTRIGRVTAGPAGAVFDSRRPEQPLNGRLGYEHTDHSQ